MYHGGGKQRVLTMNFYTSAPKWNNALKIPHTSKHALPTNPQKVKGQIITVRDATFRGATFSGRFLLAEPVDRADQSTREVKIYCRWFNHKLKRDIPRFTVNLSTASFSVNGVVYTDFSNGT